MPLFRSLLLATSLPSAASLAEGLRGPLQELSRSLLQKPVSLALFEDKPLLGEALSACHEAQADTDAPEADDGPCRQARYLDSLRRQVSSLTAGAGKAKTGIKFEEPSSDVAYAQLFVDYIAVC